MKNKENKFLMLISALTLISTVVFFTYVIFSSLSKTNVEKTKAKETLNISTTGTLNNTININPTIWVNEKESENNLNISKMSFIVNTTNSTTTTANYDVYLQIKDIKFDFEDNIKILDNLNWKLFEKQDNDIYKLVNFGNFSQKSINDNITISDKISIPYGGSIDEYKLYIYEDATNIADKNQKINLDVKLIIKNNK